MQTGNSLYDITVAGKTFVRLEIREVLPESLVNAALSENRLAQSMIMAWLQGLERHREKFAHISDKLPG